MELLGFAFQLQVLKLAWKRRTDGSLGSGRFLDGNYMEARGASAVAPAPQIVEPFQTTAASLLVPAVCGATDWKTAQSSQRPATMR